MYFLQMDANCDSNRNTIEIDRPLKGINLSLENINSSDYINNVSFFIRIHVDSSHSTETGNISLVIIH